MLTIHFYGTHKHTKEVGGHISIMTQFLNQKALLSSKDRKIPAFLVFPERVLCTKH